MIHAATAEVQACVTLAAGSGALAGHTIGFNVHTDAGDSTLSVVAPASGATACKRVPGGAPVGSTVTIAQQPQAVATASGIAVTPPARDAGSAGQTARLVVGKGVTTATFTEQALGYVSVCAVRGQGTGPRKSFAFSVNGGAPVTVRVGTCSPAVAAPVGTATVEAQLVAPFVVQGVTANDDRLLSGPAENPARVQVVFGGVENETDATFTIARQKS